MARSPSSAAKTAQSDPSGLSTLLRKRLREVGGIGLIAVAFAVAAALLTYSSSDASLNSASDRPVGNVLGLPGAYVADLLLQATGVASAGIVVVLGAWGIRLFGHRPVGLLWLRLAILPIGVFLLAATVDALPVPEAWSLSVGLGGVAGDLLLHQASGWMSEGLAALAAFVLAVPVLMLAAGTTPADLRRGAAGVAALFGVVAGLVGRMRSPDERAARRAPRSFRPVERAEPTLDGSESRRPVRRLDADSEDAPDDRTAIVEKRAKEASAAKKARPQEQPRLNLSRDEYQLPPLDILALPRDAGRPQAVDEDALAQNARLLESVLDDFGVNGTIVKVRPGPVVTLYELEPAPGTKSSRVIGLADDIARSMSAVSVRVAVIPGRNVIGIELPNAKRETVYLRELLDSETFEETGGRLQLALGKDIGGTPVAVDLARMPHLLIAGTTGSGKSVGINTMILSLLYRLPPEQCKFIMIDPKMLELSVYDGIPHLLAPVVTDPGKAVVALKWTVREMESRYRAMSQLGVRNIAGYNARLAEARAKGEVLTRRVQTGFDGDTGKPVFEDQPLNLDPLPFIVVVVDEMADLMLVAGKDIEGAIQRLAQMARAAGIHLIMATQRPSVDVITGTIKANFPTRISFQVTSKIDSRTILGEQGAEQLLGQGDMLYMAGGGRITRVHGPFVSDEEVEHVVRFLKTQGEPSYIEAVTEDEDDGMAAFGGPGNGNGDASDELYDQAVALVCRERKASTSFIQRHFQIGYNRAARIVERMEAEGVVGKANHVGKREVLARNIEED